MLRHNQRMNPRKVLTQLAILVIWQLQRVCVRESQLWVQLWSVGSLKVWPRFWAGPSGFELHDATNLFLWVAFLRHIAYARLIVRIISLFFLCICFCTIVPFLLNKWMGNSLDGLRKNLAKISITRHSWIMYPEEYNYPNFEQRHNARHLVRELWLHDTKDRTRRHITPSSFP